MPAPAVSSRRSMLGGLVASCLILLVVGITVVGISPTPPLPARAGTLAAIAGLVVAALWLRRRDRRNYERALAHEAAGRAVAEDRLVIARELHDAVSRSLGAITVRAAVAQRLATDPDGLRGALHDAEEASHEATDGLRRMLAVLRVDRAGAAGADGVASLEPALAGAVARARRTGVSVTVDGGRGFRPPPVVETAIRVVDEALANTVRHAGPTRARVALVALASTAGS
ncbi:sensor histidine kinase [Actinomyces israelii]|uniref:sensor histidine kinase n=1 Tax=Actinomyces israelii TaxID=1659 RepID=UPI0023534864|nr:histidine kinase [Actinomyces israelii]